MSGGSTAAMRTGLPVALHAAELRARRHRLGMSQAMLAAAIGVAPNTVARWERGELRIAAPSRVLATLARLEEKARVDWPELHRRPRHNLPAHLPPCIGREEAVAEVLDVLLRSESGLVTLTGTGGCGKTRLALQVAFQLLERASRNPIEVDEVWLIDLAPITEPSLLAKTVGAVLGVRERPGEVISETLFANLERRRVLLLVDNCEHMVEAVATAADQLLRRCPGVRVLATSRQPLRVKGEIIWRVPSLAFPDPLRSSDVDEVRESPAVQLFLARVRSIQTGFDLTSENARAVAEVCARLDGLPLAIELAATRLRVLGLAELCNRLDSSFKLLVGGDRTAPGRHRTLQATLDWSHELLSPAEQVVFRRLAVFARGCTLEAVEAVCGDEPIEREDVLEILAGLVDKSMVLKTEVGGEARYGQLETLRQYSYLKLRESAEIADVQRRQALWCVALADKAAPHMQTREEHHWIARIDGERDNVRAALAWCAAEDGNGSEIGLRLLDVLGFVWFGRHPQAEDLRWIERILAVDRGPARPIRARVLHWGAEFAIHLGNLQRSDELAEEALHLSRTLGYLAGEALALGRSGMNAHLRGLREKSSKRLEEAVRIAHASGDSLAIFYATQKLSEVFRLGGQLDAAARLIEDNLARAKQRGDIWGIANGLRMLALVAEDKQEYVHAAHLLEQSLSLWQETGATWGPDRALVELGRVVLAQGDVARARMLIGESLRLCRDAGNMRPVVRCLEGLATAASACGQATQAARLFGAASSLSEVVALPPPPGARTSYARGLAAAQEQLGDEAFARAWAEGRALPLEQALSEAKDVATPPAQLHIGGLASTSKGSGRLTARQAEVLRLVGEGKTDRQIAAELVLSEKTVGRHLENIFARLGVSSRAAASLVAMRAGLT